MLSSYEVSLNYDETSIYIISESWGIHSSQCQSPGFYTKHTNPALSRYWTWWVRWALHCNIHTRFMIDNKLGMCLFYDCSCMLHILSYSTSSCPVRIVGAPLMASFSSFFHLSLHVLHSPLGVGEVQPSPLCFWCCLPTSSSLYLFFSCLSLHIASWPLQSQMNSWTFCVMIVRCDGTSSVCTTWQL